MDRFVDRRFFLKATGMSLALSVAGPAVARVLQDPRRSGEDFRIATRRNHLLQTETPTMVMVFLRGGADGLNICVPTAAGEYGLYSTYRPTLKVDSAAIQSAGTGLTDAGGGDLGFGLHPRAQWLMPLWQSGALAVLPDVHYENGSRSHFDSQQFYENGTPQNKLTPEGWANRYLETAAPANPLLRAVAFDTQTPFSLRGDYPTLTFSDLSDLSVSTNSGRNDRYLDTQEQAYPLTQASPRIFDPEVATAGKSLVDAIRWIESVSPLPATEPGVPYPDASYANGYYNYFGTRLKDLAKLIKSDAFHIEFAEVDLYSWDTHNGQLSATYNHPDLTEALARGLRAFYDDLGPTYRRNVVVLVLSEFGRTARENGSAGTDHGSATVSFVMGDPSKVLGRRVVHGAGGWRGLSDLRENRDLKHSTDYRDLIFEILSRHMGNSSPDIFPGFATSPAGVIA